MDSRVVKLVLALLIGIPLALYLGIGAATQGIKTTMTVLAVGGFIFCLVLGRKIWLLLMFMSALGLQLALPGQPNTALLGQVAFLAFGGLLLLIRRLPMQVQIGELELWGLLVLACVAQVYMRNPVSLNILGGSSVGGKPYALFAVAVCSGLLLSMLKVPPKELKIAMWLTLFGALCSFGISVVGYFVPMLGVWIGAASMNQSDADYGAERIDENAATRIIFLGAFGASLARGIGAFISPIRACFHPLWLPLVLISFAAAGMSGFRSSIGMVGLNFVFAIYYWNGIKGVLFSAFAGGMALSLLAVVNLITPLPPNIQRALTVLPGTWEKRYKYDADYSTEWRTEMWKEALYSDRYIENKWIGDGLGTNAAALKRVSALMESERQGRGAGGFDIRREIALLVGDYHSGPVQTIRTIGYLGLSVLLLAQIRLAAHAGRQIRRCKGTEWFPVALFFGIPIIWAPLFFFFVFGTFAGASVSLFTGIGIIRLLERNLPLPQYATRSRDNYKPMLVGLGPNLRGDKHSGVHSGG